MPDLQSVPVALNVQRCRKHKRCIHRFGMGHAGRCIQYDETTRKRSRIMPDEPGWNEVAQAAPEAQSSPEAAPITEQPHIVGIGTSGFETVPFASGNLSEKNEAGMYRVLLVCFHHLCSCSALRSRLFGMCADVNVEPCPKHHKCIHRFGKGHPGRCFQYDHAAHKRTVIPQDDSDWKIEKKEPSKAEPILFEAPAFNPKVHGLLPSPKDKQKRS